MLNTIDWLVIDRLIDIDWKKHNDFALFNLKILKNRNYRKIVYTRNILSHRLFRDYLEIIVYIERG